MSYLTVPLQAAHKKKDFDCGKPSLNHYLHVQAKRDVKRMLAACFILEGDQYNVHGYYTLSNASIPRNWLPENIKTKMPPSYADLPATLMGRLAVDLKNAGQGLGKLLLVDALKRSYETSGTIGSMAVIVYPLDEEAEKFYLRFGFIKLPDSGKMFLAMGTIARLF
ncbi:MAG TPA: GNAT family N-acetyltransferase [Puia sp.]|jgi:predicted GNAT family N-acyltransferase|nr:GNAT family N-acetyltransferase [Puia sp.]